MKPRILLPLIALLALPSSAAEPNPSEQVDNVIQTGEATLHVVESMKWTISDPSSYDGTARFFTQEFGVTNVAVAVGPPGGVKRELASDAYQKDGPAQNGFQGWRANLSAVQPNVTAGSSYAVIIEYDVSGNVLNLRTRYTVASLALIATSQSGFLPESSLFPNLAKIGPNQHHGAAQNVQSDTDNTLAFKRTGAEGAASNVSGSPYLWGAGGLVLGGFLVYGFVRQGWMTPTARSKKFQKGGAMESRTMLEARRRTLLAALKDLEQAHEAKDVPDDAYFPLKEEYKQQAVRVMRTLEEKKE